MRSLQRFRLTGITFLAVACLASPAGADIGRAVDYLATGQGVDGSLANTADPAAPAQATAEALRALRFVSQVARIDAPAALDFLNASAPRNTETLARLIVANAAAGAGVAALIDELLAHQNGNGGFGDFAGYDSSALDTAFALDALAGSSPSSAGAAAAVGYLLSTQHSPGGWSLGANPPSVYLTALAMRALWHYRNAFAGVTDALRNAELFLLAERNPATGLWQETFASAQALIALVPNAVEFAQIEAPLTALRNAQQADGSWDGSVYTTALALRALASQPTPPPPVPTTGAITGRILDSTTRRPIGGAGVVVDALVLSQPADASGNFTLDGLDPASYALRATAPGYADVMLASVSVTAGTTVGVGNVLLAPVPTSGVLQGRVTDAVSGQVLADALVVVSGAASASVNTGSGGAFSLAPLAPGQSTITVTRGGYFPVVASATIVAGGTLVFNPTLTPTASGSEPLPGVTQTGAVRGVVTDVASGAPLARALVTVRDALSGASLRSQYTATAGDYSMADIQPGQLTIEVRLGGYLTVNAAGTLNAGAALVFSPGMVLAGGDPADGTGEISGELLPGTPTTGALQGVITDAETGLPLAGAAIEVSGANARSALSGADGSYAIADLEPGAISVDVALGGYLGVTASGQVVAGQLLSFSPTLNPDGFAGTGVGRIVGRVVDAGTGAALRTVLVSVAGAAGEVTRTTDSLGAFALDGLDPGNYRVTLSRAGYLTQAFSAVVVSGAVVDMQTVALNPALSTVSIVGTITESGSGLPIEGAVVSILGTAISVQSNAQGSYRIDGLETGSRTLLFSATGFNSQTFNFSFALGGVSEIDRALTPTSASGVSLTFLATDQASYGAYRAGVMQATVQNNGPLLEAMVTFSLYDDGDELIGQFAATRPGDPATLIAFAPAGIDTVSAAFNTANLPPGSYRVVGRLLVGNQLVGPATAILAERVTAFTITPVTRITRLEAGIAPGFSALGVTEQLELLVSIVNRSNVHQTLRVDYTLRLPNGTPVRSRSIQVPLAPAQDNLSVVLDSFELTFDVAGEYALQITNAGSIVVDAAGNTVQTGISVAPALRIDPAQSVAPTTVTPDEDQRVRINIRLEGREVQ